MSDLSRAMQEATAYVDRQKDERKRHTKEIQEEIPTEVSTFRGRRQIQNNPTAIIAYGVAVALAIVAAGISTQWLVPALGAGFGIATTIISKGIVAAEVDYSWIVPTGAVGVGLVGAVAIVFLLTSIVNRAVKQPYLATLPVLAVLAGFFMNWCKDFYPNLFLVRIGFGAVTCALFVMGGLWWKRYGLLNKLAGTLLFLISPLVVLADAVRGNLDQGLGNALGNVAAQSWLALGGVFALIVVAGLLAFTLGEEINQPG